MHRTYSLSSFFTSMRFQVTFQEMTVSDLFIVNCWNDKVVTKQLVSTNMTTERICRWSGFQQLEVWMIVSI